MFFHAQIPISFFFFFFLDILIKIHFQINFYVNAQFSLLSTIYVFNIISLSLM